MKWRRILKEHCSSVLETVPIKQSRKQNNKYLKYYLSSAVSCCSVFCSHSYLIGLCIIRNK